MLMTLGSVHLAHSLNVVRIMLDISDKFAVDFDIKFYSSKSTVMGHGLMLLVHHSLCLAVS